MNPAIWVVIPCAGKGKRFGSITPKQYQPLGNITVLEQTLQCFLPRADVCGVVVAHAADDHWVSRLPADDRLHFVHGGAERADSVRAALEYLLSLASADDLVAVHDAARPCVRQQELDRLFLLAGREPDGAILALPATDTIKWVEQQQISRTINREQVYLAQTPQVFRLGLLHQALTNALAQGLVITDDASAMELAGYKPYIVSGHKSNLKITQPEDLLLAEFYLQHFAGERN